MNHFQNIETNLKFNKYFSNKNLIDEISINNNEIKFSEQLQQLLYFYFINETIFIYCKNKNINFIDFIKINELKIMDSYYDFLDKFIIDNMFKLLNEYDEYKIFEGYEEIVSLFVFNIYQEELELKKDKNNKLTLSKILNKKIKLTSNKINKFLNKKFH
jgi:hypothetical protein